MGTIKDRTDMDIKEAEDIKKRQQKYTEELYKKDLRDPNKHYGFITHINQTSWGVKSQVGLKNSWVKTEAKDKGERKRCTHLKAELKE